jgi:glycosyltransferase involved in cell wall biosynthesis
MLTGEAKLSALSAATVWALPSHTENFGVAVVEALAAGVPTVVSPAVNISPDLDRAGAALVAENKVDAFASALRRLLDDEVERRSLAEAGPLFAQRYGRRAVGKQLADVYAELLRPVRTVDAALVVGGAHG